MERGKMRDIKINSAGGGNLNFWLAVLVLAAVFLIWGLFIFFTVGVKWPPAWDFGALPDVPGQSIYSTHALQPGQTSGSSLHQEGKLVPQHVKSPPQNN
jgi:hypothetical protein